MIVNLKLYNLGSCNYKIKFKFKYLLEEKELFV